MFVISVFEKNISTIFAVVAYSFNNNKTILHRVGPSFVRCHCYRLNLYVQDVINQLRYEMTKISALIKQLSFDLPAAKVRSATPLSAVQCNKTLWSSSYVTLKKFRDLEPFVIKIYDD